MPVTNLPATIKNLNSWYYKLLLLVGEQSYARNHLLGELARAWNCTPTSINIELSKLLKDIPRSKRCYYVHDYLDKIIDDIGTELVFLGNMEILFSSHLRINPLAQLKHISKYRPVIAAWNGRIDNNCLLYGEISHPDYVSYRLSELDCPYYEIKEGGS